MPRRLIKSDLVKVRVETELKVRARARAEEHGLTLSEHVRELVLRDLGANGRAAVQEQSVQEQSEVTEPTIR